MNIEITTDPAAALDAAQAEFDAFFKLDPAEEAMLNELFRDIDIQRAGRWYAFPSPLWEPPKVHYYRCGRAGDARAEALAYAMRMLRWKDAPSSVRQHGAESDFVNGGKGLYLCITDENHQRWNEWRAAQKRKKGKKITAESQSVIADAVAQSGAVIESFSATPKTGQAMLDAKRELAEKRAARARNPRG